MTTTQDRERKLTVFSCRYTQAAVSLLQSLQLYSSSLSWAAVIVVLQQQIEDFICQSTDSCHESLIHFVHTCWLFLFNRQRFHLLLSWLLHISMFFFAHCICASSQTKCPITEPHATLFFLSLQYLQISIYFLTKVHS